MGRPKIVKYENLGQFDKFHTEMTRMYSGVQLNTLYPIKETPQFYLSLEVWAFCASKFKRKKKNLPQLSVDIKTVTNQEVVDFFKNRFRIKRELDGDNLEAVTFLRRLYPNHVYEPFRDLKDLLAAYCNGAFVRYKENKETGEWVEQPFEPDNQTKYYNHKFKQFLKDLPKDIKKLWDAYKNYSKEKLGDKYDDNKSSELFGKYWDAEEEYVYQNFNKTHIFRAIGEHAVCLPMAFSRSTGEWTMEKYGKRCSYGDAGEVFFVVTEDTIYFDIGRHY